MNYTDAMNYMESLNGLGSVPGLDSIRELLNRLENPQDSTRFIHIAGTNGKGSVNSFIYSVLRKAGYRTGRYISPAVREPLEIIQCDGHNISKEDFANIIEVISKVCSEMVQTGLPHPTRFEIETAAAFCYFQKNSCEYAVVECGMGGLLDATNVIKNTECAVITSISIDHTAYLGNTLAEIARHKAGIIKAGCKVVCLRQNNEVNQVVEAAAKKNGCQLFWAEPDQITDCYMDTERTTFKYNTDTITIGLTGSYQPVNAIIGLTACNALKIDSGAIYAGMKAATWFGRFTFLGHNPDFVIDGAHNRDGAHMLEMCINQYFSGRKITMIMGSFKDKDYDYMAHIASKYAAAILTINTPDNPRALPADELAKHIAAIYNGCVKAYASIDEAVHAAIDITPDQGVIIAWGSLSHLAYIEDAYNKETNHGR